MDPLSNYRTDPAGYAKDILGVQWWAKQAEIAALLLTPPYRVLVKAAHGVGKTFLAAGLVSWYFRCFHPSAVITTAPTARDVKDLLWREIRLQHRGEGFAGGKVAELREAPDHYAKGFTAALGESFQGRHQQHMFFVFDEATGVDSIFWETTKSMFAATGNHHWLAIGNPTDTSSQMYAEEMSESADGAPAWHVVTMSALDHPNIQAELQGQPPPFPPAVRLAQFEAWVADWCDPIPAAEATALDLQWPPDSGRFWRAGPEMQSRALGRWPSAGTFGVFSDLLWRSAECPLEVPPAVLPEIGCDVARFGDDYTAIHVRCGPVSLHHERHNGWPLTQTIGRLAELAGQWATWSTNRQPLSAEPIQPPQIRIKVDDDGVGGGVTDGLRELGLHVAAVNGAGRPAAPDRYPNRRSEQWFSLAERARHGELSFARLPERTRRIMQRQAMGPVWKLNSRGLRELEPKSKTKERLGTGSPDDLDATALAYYEGVTFDAPTPLGAGRAELPQRPGQKKGGAADNRHLFGRR